MTIGTGTAILKKVGDTPISPTKVERGLLSTTTIAAPS